MISICKIKKSKFIFKTFYNKQGYLHNDGDKPSFQRINGNKIELLMWHKKGKLHRENNYCFVSFSGNIQEWRIENLFHREDGPAEISPVFSCWWHCGIRHKEDAPAIIFNNGDFNLYINGNYILNYEILLIYKECTYNIDL